MAEPHVIGDDLLPCLDRQVVKRVGCGYRNMDNYQRRILSHIAVTRPQRSAA